MRGISSGFANPPTEAKAHDFAWNKVVPFRSGRQSFSSEFEPITHLCGDHSRIVEVKSPDRDAFVLQDAMIGDVHCTRCEGQPLTKAMSKR